MHLFREGLVIFRAKIRGRERARIGKRQKRFARHLARSEQCIGLLEEFVGLLEERVGRFLPGGRCRGIARGRRKLEQLAGDHSSRARLRRKAHAFHAARTRDCGAGDFANHVLDGRLGEAAMRTRGIFRKQRIKTARRPEFVLPRKHLLNRGVEQVGSRRLVEHRERGVDAQLRGMHAQDARAHAVDGRNPCVVDLERLGRHAFRGKRRLHARFNFSSGLVGKCDGQNLVDVFQKRRAVGTRPGQQCPRDALGEREGFATARARRHRHGGIERFHATQLAFFERRKIHRTTPSFAGR